MAFLKSKKDGKFDVNTLMHQGELLRYEASTGPIEMELGELLKSMGDYPFGEENSKYDRYAVFGEKLIRLGLASMAYAKGRNIEDAIDAEYSGKALMEKVDELIALQPAAKKRREEKILAKRQKIMEITEQANQEEKQL